MLKKNIIITLETNDFTFSSKDFGIIICFIKMLKDDKISISKISQEYSTFVYNQTIKSQFYSGISITFERV